MSGLMTVGVAVVGETEEARLHSETLARKNAMFFEAHAHRDGEVVIKREVWMGNARGASILR